jgi:hypothetical protein
VEAVCTTVAIERLSRVIRHAEERRRCLLPRCRGSRRVGGRSAGSRFALRVPRLPPRRAGAKLTRCDRAEAQGGPAASMTAERLSSRGPARRGALVWGRRAGLDPRGAGRATRVLVGTEHLGGSKALTS